MNIHHLLVDVFSVLEKVDFQPAMSIYWRVISWQFHLTCLTSLTCFGKVGSFWKVCSDANHMDVSANRGTPKSIINHPFWGTPIFGNTHIEFGNLLGP